MILVKIIKHAPDNSKILNFSIETYRMFYSGHEVILDEVIIDEIDKMNWKETMGKVIHEIKYSGETSSDFLKRWNNGKELLLLCE